MKSVTARLLPVMNRCRACLLFLIGCGATSPRPVPMVVSAPPPHPSPSPAAESPAQPAPIEPSPGQASSAQPPASPGWAITCRQALIDAERGFRAAAPKLYPPYASLDWQSEPESNDSDIPGVETFPGRSWKFAATVVTVDTSPYPPLAVVGPRWQWLQGEDAVYARREGDYVRLVMVETERSAVPVAKHPLVVDYAKRMRTALDSCRPE